MASRLDLRSSLYALILSLISGLAFTGCGGSSTSTESGESSDGAPGLVYADNWHELVIDANSAKIKVTGSGHLVTSRNACGRPADKAFELAEANEFVTDINQIVRQAGSGNTCVPVDSGRCFSWTGSGTAYVMMDNGGKQSILEVKNGEVCAPVADRELVLKISKTLDRISYDADAEECAPEMVRCTR